MTTSRIPTWTRIGAGCALATVSTGLGSGISAAIRGGDITESASVVGLGTGLFVAGFGTADKLGLFGEIKPKPPSPTSHVLGAAFLELIGTSIGYFGTKLFINAAVSTAPFADAALGLPITAGVLFCGKLLLDYYDQIQNVKNANLKPYTP